MLEVTYEYYKNVYGGTLLSEQLFSKYSKDAIIYIRNRTFDNVMGVEEDNTYADVVKHAVCSISDMVSVNTSEDGSLDRLVASETTADWSKSYVTSKGSSEESTESRINKRIETLLGFTGLLYGGMY